MANWFYHSFHSSGKGDTTFLNFSEGQYQQHKKNSCVKPSRVLLPYLVKRKKRKRKKFYSSLQDTLNIPNAILSMSSVYTFISPLSYFWNAKKIVT